MTHQIQQTEETRSQNADLWEALNFKKTPEETDSALQAYFAEKAKRRAR